MTKKRVLQYRQVRGTEKEKLERSQAALPAPAKEEPTPLTKAEMRNLLRMARDVVQAQEDARHGQP